MASVIAQFVRGQFGRGINVCDPAAGIAPVLNLLVYLAGICNFGIIVGAQGNTEIINARFGIIAVLSRYENIPSVLAKLLALPIPKITFDAKPLYRFAMRWDIPYSGELEDVKLQAYLLSNSDKSYPIPDLVRTYCPGMEQFPEELRDTAALEPLYDAMEQILEEKQRKWRSFSGLQKAFQPGRHFYS